ncbi:unannotated protein [freshwater metagenome]|uniref:Unannotated protein n=1 Tax=freshwater metagenome TaxID=449393 RepID=A0A6J7BHT7_9ZZZZ|nr:DUF2752 domain-containing protein [Actinomycetota bacterium]MSY52200.1 DUF2752 domain-containing protein [Actinomycetota bacterium]
MKTGASSQARTRPLSYWPALFREIPAARYALVLFATALTWVGARRTEGYTTGPILCPFRLITGHQCPFCGTTRSFGALVQGDISGSIAYNPSGILLSIVILFWMISPAKLREVRVRIAQAWWRISEPTRWMLLALLIGTVAGYILARW